MNHFLWIVACSLIISLSSAEAECFLPIPDGGPENYAPSRENLWGDIEKVELPFVYVNSGNTHQLVKVSLSKIDQIYSAYGGSESFSVLRPHMQVWVWFENCKVPSSGAANAAYFQYFSSDPNDRAKLSRDGRIIAVPN